MANTVGVPSATGGRHPAEPAGRRAGRAAATVCRDAVRAGRRRLRAGGPPTPLTRRRQPSPTAVLLLVAAFGAFLAFLEQHRIPRVAPDRRRPRGRPDRNW
jgi:NTE family protein